MNLRSHSTASAAVPTLKLSLLLTVIAQAIIVSVLTGCPSIHPAVQQDLEIRAQGDAYEFYIRSQYYRDQGDYPLAIAYARDAYAIRPDETIVVLSLGRMLREDAQYEEAVRILAAALPHVDEPDSVAIELALNQDLSGQDEAAEQTLVHAIARNPGNYELTYAYVDFLAQEDRTADAEAPLRQYLALASDDAEAWRHLGTVLRHADQPSEAIIAFERAFDLDPEESDFLALISSASASGDYDVELVWAEACFERYRQNVSCRVEHIRSLQSQPLDPEALEEATFQVLRQLALNIGTNVPRLRRVAGYLGRELDLERGFVFLRAIADERPAVTQIQSITAWTAYRLQDEELACVYMNRVLEVRPRSPDALNFIGYSYAERGIRLDEAEQLILEALDIRPSDGNIQDSLGWVYFMTERFDEAVIWLERAVENIPNSAVLLDHLADAYREVGRGDAALETYRSAIEAANDDEEALIISIQAKISELELAIGS